MRTYPNCIPCILRATLGGARLGGAGENEAWEVVAAGARIAADWDRSKPPILLGAQVGRVLRKRLGRDPYQEAKREANVRALARYNQWKAEVARAPDPLFHALRLAAAGNALDLGVHPEDDPGRTLESPSGEFARLDYAEFRSALAGALNVLYLTDNAGEIVLDRVLIEVLIEHGTTVTVAVRGSPTLNDVTMEDAQQVGLTAVAEVITTGSDVPGVYLDACSPAFRSRFQRAEIILSKGMGNFEGLSEEEAPLFFLFQAKCRPVAQEAGVRVGDLALLRRRG